MRPIILCSLLLLAAMTAQADDNLLCPVPVFAECPDTLTADCGDTIRYQFQLLDQRNGQPRVDARYFIAKGYGEIDSLSGEYILEIKLPDFRLVGATKIGAYFAPSIRSDTAFCTFMAMICPGGPPRIAGDCPLHVGSFQRGTPIQARLFAASVCSDLSWSVIAPDNYGVTATIDQRGLLSLMGTMVGDYTTYVILTDSCGADTCEVSFTVTDNYPYDVRIEQLRNQIQGQYAYVDVTIDSVLPARGLGGYDLLIKYDNSALTLSEVIEGDIFAQCGWEYFTYRMGADGNCPECPSGLVRVIGIAETNNGDDHPTCDVPDSLPATLFRMKFLVSNDRTLECQYTPIQFYWRDCDDNQLASNDDHLIKLIADRVFDSVGAMFPIDSSSAFLPGTNGLPWQTCQTAENEKPSIRRLVDFYHGGIGIVCRDSIDFRGDVNLNGFPYELADLVLFSRYFIYGLPVFTINLSGQVAASDVNYDNNPLTVEDYCYMYQVIIGNELPRDQIPPLDTVRFELNEGILSFEPGDTLGAVFLTVEGNATPTLVAYSTSMQYVFDGSVTRILISPNLESVWPPPVEDPYLFGGAFLAGLGDHEILSIETADYHGGKLVSVIMPPLDVPYAIRISKAHNALQGTFSDIDVILERSEPEMGLCGFNLLLTYNPQHLTPTEVTRGSIFDSCAWEYFTYRYGADGNCGTTGCPTGIIRVIGIAETNNGETHPSENCHIDGLTLFSIKFLVSNERNLNCAFLPVRPFWIDCGDNTLADETGQILLLANNVYRYCDSLPFPPEDAVFPGIAGVPVGACPGHPGYPPLRWVDFYPGGVDVACADSADGRGDVNINGLPFEIADELLFARYLVHGDSVLTISKRGQLVTTDINSDGKMGSIEDYVLLHRQVHGLGSSCWADDIAFAGMPPGRADFSISNSTLFVEANDTLGAVIVTVAGYAWPRQIAPHMKVRLYFDQTVTRVLIAPDTENPGPDDYILSGPIIDGIEPGHILSIDAASWRGEKMTSHFAGELPEMALSIGKVDAIYQGPTVTVPVKLQRLADHISLAGFDLLITFDDSALIFESVIPGSLYELAGWEYFNWRLDNPALCQADCPGGLLRVIGLADINNGTALSGSYPRGVVQTLFNVTFRIGDSRLYECLDIPVGFYWTNCDDNQCLAYPNLPLRARHVYSHGFPFLTDTHYPEDSATFPGIKGTPPGACDYTPFGGIDYFHGSVHIPCEPYLDYHGDLNLNDLAYEIADEMLFAAYFLNGLPAFTINPLAQEATSDINRDGTTLTVEDYVLMHRIINGWALPHDNPPDDPDTVRFLHAYGPLYAATDDTLGAVAIVVAGNITPLSMLNNMVMEYAFDGTNTHIFIHAPHGSTDSTAYILTGPIVNLQTVNEILSISTCTHRGNRIASRVDIMSDAGEGDDPNLPATFALHQNYPNPFNAGTVISFDLPRTAEVNLEIINVLGNVVYRKKMTCSAGTQQINWNGITTGGSEVASGVYYYRLTAGSFTDTKKMLLLK